MSDFSVGNFEKAQSSNAIPGLLQATGVSRDGKYHAIMIENRLGISHTTAFDPQFFFLQEPSSSVGKTRKPQVQFSPENSNQIAVLFGRDIRIYDIERSLNTPGANGSKAMGVIAGASTQALPVSFTYNPHSPNMLISGWDIPGNEYIRIIDLREGTNKSIRITKSNQVNGLVCSDIDDCVIASFAGSTIQVQDIRNLCTKTGSAVVTSSPTPSPIHNILFHPRKKSTIASLLENESVTVWRSDTGRLMNVPGSGIGAITWSIKDPYSLITMEKVTGKVDVSQVPNFPIPLVNTRTGALEVFVDHKTEILRESDIHIQVLDLVSHLAESPDVSLIDALLKSEDDELLDEIDWAIPDHVNISSIQEPLWAEIEGEIVISSDPNPLIGIPVLSSPIRDRGIELALPKRWQRILIPLIKGDFKNLLRILLHERYPDIAFVHSVTEIVISKPDACLRFDNSPDIIKDACRVLNRMMKTTTDSAVLTRELDNEKLNIFVKISFALTYLKSERLVEYLMKLSTSSNGLRWLAVVGLLNFPKFGEIVNCRNIFPVAILGLLLSAAEDGGQVHSIFKKPIAFLRDLCNQLRGDCWSLRAIIDAATTTPSSEGSGGGESVIICYYCNKPLTGGDVFVDSTSISRCPHRGCHKPLPSCCVCLEPVQIGGSAEARNDWWIVFCGTCRHGGHKDHVSDWFNSFEECPVAGCNCQCSNVDGV